MVSHMLLWFELKNIYGNKLISMFSIPTLKHFDDIEYIHALPLKGFIRLEKMLLKRDVKIQDITKYKREMARIAILIFYPSLILTLLAMFLCTMK
jgi:hypothetical protein